MEVAHELAPAEELADETFGAGERNTAFDGGPLDIGDHLRGEQAPKIDEAGGAAVKELELVVAHGVFEWAEVGEEMLEREAPGAVGVGLSYGAVEVVDRAKVVAVLALDVVDDFERDVVGREREWLGNGNLSLVRVAVFGVVGELAADGAGRSA